MTISYDYEEHAVLCPFDHDNCQAEGCDCWCHNEPEP